MRAPTRPTARGSAMPLQLELRFGNPGGATDAAPTFLARLRALGLRGIRSCTLTANRTTMVSYRADRLRVQRAFLDAPQAVLRAVVAFVNGPRGARRRARQALVAFGPTVPPSTRPRRASEVSHPDDAPLVERLRLAHQELNRDRFDGALQTVTIRVSRRMRARLGHYAPSGGAAEIAIARRHFRRDGWDAVLETLAHEMIHQWQHETSRPIAHDRDFRRKARAVGIDTRARRVLTPRAAAQGTAGSQTSRSTSRSRRPS